MSPDQVTRAAPGKSSNVSPGDSIGGIVFWGKEIMYHRQQKKKISPQSLPSPGRLLPCPVRSKKGALSAEGAGGYVAVGIEEAPGIIHTHTHTHTHTQNEGKKSVLISEQTPPIIRELGRLTHGEGKSHWQSSVHGKMDGRTYCKKVPLLLGPEKTLMLGKIEGGRRRG